MFFAYNLHIRPAVVTPVPAAGATARSYTALQNAQLSAGRRSSDDSFFSLGWEIP